MLVPHNDGRDGVRIVMKVCGWRREMFALRLPLLPTMERGGEGHFRWLLWVALVCRGGSVWEM